MIHFVYALSDPRTDDVKYLGVTDDPKNRLVNHMHLARTGDTAPKYKWIRTLMKIGLKPKMAIISEHKTRSDAILREREEILRYKITGSITNHIGTVDPRDTITFSGPPGTAKDLTELAHANNRNRSEEIVDAIERRLKAWREKLHSGARIPGATPKKKGTK